MTIPTASRTALTQAAPAPGQPRPGWLLGRGLDTVVIANWWWPVLAVAFATSGWLHSGLSWWQLYLVSSPHRWITLPLVFGEGERVRAQWRRFAAVGAALVALGGTLLALGMRASTGMAALGLLMSVDYVWNAWHFASQGAGINRIYGRAVAPDTDRRVAESEKSMFRTVVIWTFLRLAIVVGATSANTRIDFDISGLDRLTRWGDLIALGIAAVLVYRVARRSSPGHRSQLSYTTSFMTLYGLQLFGLHTHRVALVGYLAFAAAVFHASEYLAVCSWAASRKRDGLWRRPAARSVGALVVFIAVVGGLNWAVALWSVWAWAAMTLVVSLLHYGYDGMIWRSSPKRQVALS